MPYLKTSSGLTWYYEDAGRGPFVLFVHGFGVNCRVWRQQIKYFSERYRVIAVDLPGHGRSGWQKMSLHQMALDVDYILRELGCRGIGIVASSFGGLLALKLLELNSEMVNFFVFAGSLPKFCQTDDYPFGLQRQRIRKLSQQLESDYPLMVHVFFRSLFTRQERQTRRFKWIQTFRKTDFVPQKQALLNLLVILEKEDLRTIFFESSVPVLFINGTDDYICQRDFYLGLKDRFLRAQFTWFENCGHFPFLSKPHEFNEVLQGFMSNHSFQTPSPEHEK